MGQKCQMARENMSYSFRNIANKSKQADGCRFRITRVSKGKNAMLLWNQAWKRCI